MVLQLHDQWPGHAFHHKKCFYKWCPDSNLFGLQLCGNFWETSSASCLLRTHRALRQVNLHYFCLSRMCNASKSDLSKFQHKHYGYSWEKLKMPCFFPLAFFFLTNDRIQNFGGAIHISGTCYWFSWFSGTDRAVTVGMHASKMWPAAAEAKEQLDQLSLCGR